jgi:hypothetical protein
VTVVSAAPVARIREDDVDPPARVPEGRLDLREFLPAIAALLQETAGRLEDSAARVTKFVMTSRGRTDPNLIVTLQDFDRLQQEFTALGEALARYAATWDEASSEHASHDEFGHVIAAVTVGDLRDRLLHRLRVGEEAITLFVPPLQPLQPDDEEIF